MQSYELKLSWFDGGNLRNAIPREAYAIFGVPVRFKDEFIKRYKLFAADLEAEFRLREPNFKITLNEMPQVDRVLDARTQFGLVYSLVGVPNGVIAMSFAVPGLVETSTTSLRSNSWGTTASSSPRPSGRPSRAPRPM